MLEFSEINRRKCDQALRCWFLTGATAGGKSRIGVELAKRIGAEIISLDSMTIYRKMDIGTAKPPVAERQGIPHHLIDIIDPNETYSVSQFRDDALACAEQIRSAGKQVLFVGGTALYLKALTRGIFDGPPRTGIFEKRLRTKLRRLELRHFTNGCNRSTRCPPTNCTTMTNGGSFEHSRSTN